MSSQEGIMVINVKTNQDGVTATDRYGKKYKIESYTIGAGRYRKTFPYVKNFFLSECEYKAELLDSGKLNIIP